MQQDAKISILKYADVCLLTAAYSVSLYLCSMQPCRAATKLADGAAMCEARGCLRKEQHGLDQAAALNMHRLIAAFRCARAILDLGDREAWAMQQDGGGNGDGTVHRILTMYQEAGELFGASLEPSTPMFS